MEAVQHRRLPCTSRRSATSRPRRPSRRGRRSRSSRPPRSTATTPRSRTPSSRCRSASACRTPTSPLQLRRLAAAAARSQRCCPQSCDPGYALARHRSSAATALTTRRTSSATTRSPRSTCPASSPSYFPPTDASSTNNIPGLAYSAIGQQNVRATALQDALVAAAIANGGKEMAPHFLSLDHRRPGRRRPALQALRVAPSGGAGARPADQPADAGRRHPRSAPPPASASSPKTTSPRRPAPPRPATPSDHIDDWMIAFAPATDPVIAVAVVVPYQAFSALGRDGRGPGHEVRDRRRARHRREAAASGDRRRRAPSEPRSCPQRCGVGSAR